jgi:hypothetical protein
MITLDELLPWIVRLGTLAFLGFAVWWIGRFGMGDSKDDQE